MATPDWTQVTVYGTYTRTDNTPGRGKLIFSPRPRRFVSASSGQVIIARPVVATINPTTGAFTATLYASDDPDITPADFSYSVREIFTGGKEYDIFVPRAAALSGGINIKTVAPLETPLAGTYPPVTGGTQGPAGPAGPKGDKGDTGLKGDKGDSGDSGNSSLVVISGGTVDLDNSKPNGFLVGYRVTSTTTIEGKVFDAGSYIFERNSSVTSGWTYHIISAGLEVTAAPTAVIEDFDRTDGTTLNGKTSTTGGATLISPARSINAGNSATNAATVGGKLVVPSGADSDGRAIAVLTVQQDYEIAVDYVIPTAASTHQARVVARANIPDDNNNLGSSIILVVLGNGAVRWEVDGGVGGTLAASGAPTSGRMKLRAVGSTFSAFINGAQIGTS